MNKIVWLCGEHYADYLIGGSGKVMRGFCSLMVIAIKQGG